jgi:hypothetical protein
MEIDTPDKTDTRETETEGISGKEKPSGTISRRVAGSRIYASLYRPFPLLAIWLSKLPMDLSDPRK